MAQCRDAGGASAAPLATNFFGEQGTDWFLIFATRYGPAKLESVEPPYVQSNVTHGIVLL